MDTYFKDSIEPEELSFALAHALRFFALLDEEIYEIGEYRPFFLKESERMFRNFDTWWRDEKEEDEYEIDRAWAETGEDHHYSHRTFDEGGNDASVLANEYNVAMLVAKDWEVEEAFVDLGLNWSSEKLSKQEKEKAADLVSLRQALFFESPEGQKWIEKTKKELGGYIDLP
tara:strand:- start:32 stop:547 length:516 start_codon:yes stop_codon:yes gene_type:complete